MGLFKPAWQSDNKEKALHAVEKETDQAALAEITKNAPLIEVRIAAVGKLTGRSVLADIAKNNKDHTVGEALNRRIITLRTAEIENLTNESVLADIAMNDNDEYARWTATKKLTDLTVLESIAKNNYYSDVRRAAIEKLAEQNVLADIAKNSNSLHAKAGEAAVQKIIEQNLLCDVAKSTADWKVRLAAAEKVTDQALMQTVYADIWENNNVNGSEALRREAFNKITNQHILADIANRMNNFTFNWGVAAVGRLTEQSLIADVAKNAKNESVRIRAIENLNDKTILTSIAEHGVHVMERRTAQARMESL